MDLHAPRGRPPGRARHIYPTNTLKLAVLNTTICQLSGCQLVGHASISQTLDTYSHVLEGMDGGIGDAMDAAIG